MEWDEAFSDYRRIEIDKFEARNNQSLTASNLSK